MGFTLLIDNYDSFTWNIYADLASIGGDPYVVRNDKITLVEVEKLFNDGQLDRIVISPGPGHPRTDSGVSRQVIQWGMGKLPILGVCMGLECLVDLLGGDIGYAGEIKHGKTSLVQHDGVGIFHSLPAVLSSTRYHSLAASLTTVPSVLQVTATTQESGVVMGVRHREYTVEAVQYHPESCMSEGGRGLMANFVRIKGGVWGGENAWCGVLPGGTPTPAPTPDGQDAGAARLPTILNKIHTQRLLDIESASSIPSSSPAAISTSLALYTSPPLISFYQRVSSTPHTAVMAEIKRASPSKGDIAVDVCAPAQALKYALAGASVISVLTEPTWFKGGLADMLAVRQAVGSFPNRPAILRKDFILSRYMIDEARLYGADTVLLIVAMLERAQLKDLYDYSVSRGMEPLVEVNNTNELELALEVGARVVGVNNRNLHDFKVDMTTTSRVNAALKGHGDVLVCALSGISTPEDVATYVAEGVRAVLVGEALMRAADPRAFLRSLIGLAAPGATGEKARPLVKICGVRSVEDAQMAIEGGADMVGIILVPGTKRHVSFEVARDIANVVRDARRRACAQRARTPTDTAVPWFAQCAQTIVARAKPLVVGVFQNAALPEIIAQTTGIELDLVQLHGDEPQEWARFLPVPMIKCFHVDAQDGSVRGGEVGRPGLNVAVLLDAAGSGGSGGGEGRAFGWARAREISAGGEGGALPIVLAGGLGPGNVGRAVEEAGSGVWCVDVSSGVEGEDGMKDAGKVRAFVQAAKGGDGHDRYMV